MNAFSVICLSLVCLSRSVSLGNSSQVDWLGIPFALILFRMLLLRFLSPQFSLGPSDSGAESKQTHGMVVQRYLTDHMNSVRSCSIVKSKSNRKHPI